MHINYVTYKNYNMSYNSSDYVYAIRSENFVCFSDKFPVFLKSYLQNFFKPVLPKVGLPLTSQSH